MYSRNPNLLEIAQVMSSYVRLHDAMTDQRRELLSQTRAAVDRIDEDRKGLDRVMDDALKQGKPSIAVKYISSLSSKYPLEGQPEPVPSAVTAQTRSGTRPRGGKIYKGDLAEDVRSYVVARTRQEQFPLAVVAKHFGYYSRQLPVARIMSFIPSLSRRKIKGKTVYVRK